MYFTSALQLTLALALGALSFGSPSAGSDAPQAIACSIAGKATVEVADHPRARPLRMFERLHAGTVIQTFPQSRVRLVFRDGSRFEIAPDTRVEVKADELRVEHGSVAALTPVPAVAMLPRLARSEGSGDRPGASRIRNPGRLSGNLFELYPRDRASVLPQAATLRFAAVPGVETYRIEVTDTLGREIFVTDTTATEVVLPAGLLEPSGLYYWRVSSPHRPTAHGNALFTTPSAADATARSHLAVQARASGDVDLLLLLAEVDRHLGLQREACQGLQTALDETPLNLPLRRAVEGLGCDGGGRLTRLAHETFD